MDLRVKSCDGAAAAVAISVCNLVPPGTLKETIQLVRDVPSELSANAAVRSAHVQTSGGASGVYAALHIYADTNCAAQGKFPAPNSCRRHRPLPLFDFRSGKVPPSPASRRREITMTCITESVTTHGNGCSHLGR